MDKIVTWIKNNIVLSIGVGLVLLIIVMTGGLKKIFSTRKRVHHRPEYYANKRAKAAKGKKMHGSLPRSVGGKGYPAAGGGYIPFVHNKDGSIKKAQFVGGTLAAKRRMSALRKGL
jgi:hypothetical protein